MLLAPALDRRWVLLTGALLLVGCTPDPGRSPRGPHGASGASPRRPAPSGSAARRPGIPRRTTAPPVVHAAGVGDLRLGRPVPPRYLRPAARPTLHYVVGLHADAQTYEGFRFPSVPVLAVLARGPFHRWFESPKRKGGGLPGAPVRKTLATAATRLARGGAPVRWIVVDRPGLRTAKGIGVGSTLAALTRAYGTLTLLANPPDFGRDECAVRVAPLKTLWVYFRTCRDARAGGTITRMGLWMPGKK